MHTVLIDMHFCLRTALSGEMVSSNLGHIMSFRSSQAWAGSVVNNSVVSAGAAKHEAKAPSFLASKVLPVDALKIRNSLFLTVAGSSFIFFKK